MQLRPRESINYSSDGTNETALSVESASRWNTYTTKCVNIKVVDVDVMFNESVDLSNNATSLVVPEWTNYEWLISADVTQYDKKVQTLMRKIRKVSNSVSGSFPEVMVDGFMCSLLYFLGFDEDPCELYPQYHYSVNLGPRDRRIGATPDFGVITHKNNMMLVIENKAITSATHVNNWKEDQVLGELFIAVHHIVATSTMEITFPMNVYAVRVIGTKFTFYRATATPEYINESATLETPKNHVMEVQRHPRVIKPILTAYDICNNQDRMCILQLLCNIRQLMS